MEIITEIGYSNIIQRRICMLLCFWHIAQKRFIQLQQILDRNIMPYLLNDMNYVSLDIIKVEQALMILLTKTGRN